jgi:hypothetical protein
MKIAKATCGLRNTFEFVLFSFVSRGSSVSIVTDYGLDDRVSIPNRGLGFFF